MRFSEADSTAGHLINAYGADGIVVGERRFSVGLIVAPRHLHAPWGPSDIGGLTADDLAAVLPLDPQILVLGTGSRHQFPDPAVWSLVIEQGVGFEVMDTGAACRTYNILAAEGRRVVAALLPF